MISNITKDKAFLRKAMNDIVRYRISHTGNRKPQLVTTDFDIIEDIHTRGWDVATSFEIRYKHLLLAQAKPDQPSSEDIDRIMYAGTDSDGDEEYESTESRLTKLGMPVKDDSEEEQPGSKKYIFVSIDAMHCPESVQYKRSTDCGIYEALSYSISFYSTYPYFVSLAEEHTLKLQTSPRYPPKLVADDAPKQRKTISKPEEPSPLKKEPRKRQASPSSSKAKKTLSESKDSNTSETPKKKPKVQEPHDQSNMQFPPQMQQMYGYGPYPFGGNRESPIQVIVSPNSHSLSHTPTVLPDRIITSNRDTAHLGNPFYPHPNMGDFPSQFPPYGYGGYPGYGQQPSYPRMGPPGHRGPQDQDPRGMENSAGRHRRQEMQGVHGMHGMRAMQEFNDRHRQAGQDTYPVDPPPNMGINPHYPFRDPYYSPYSTPAPQSAYMAEGDNAGQTQISQQASSKVLLLTLSGRRVRAREQTNFGNRMDLDDDDDEEQFDRETRAALERRGREISIKREPGLYNNPISLDDNETHLNIRTYNQYVGDNNEEDPDAKVLRLQQELARAEERSKKAHARAAAEAAKRK